MSRRRACLTATFASLALAAPAAAPAAEPVFDYEVTIDGEASYNRADVYHDEDGETAGQHDHAFVFRTAYPKVQLSRDTTGAPATGRAEATVTQSHFALTGPSGERFECRGGSALAVEGGTATPTRQAQSTRLVLRPLQTLAVRVPSCDKPLTPGDLGLIRPDGPMTSAITIPDAEAGERTIVRTVTGEETGEQCPLRHAETALCSLSWTATVTLNRVDEDVFVPLTPEPQATPPAPPTPDDLFVPLTPPTAPTPAADDALFVPLTADARVTGDRAVLPITCSAACSGTVVATAGGRRGAARAARRSTLGKATFRAAAGRKARVRVRFRRPVRRNERVRLAITVRSAGRTERRNVVLRRR